MKRMFQLVAIAVVAFLVPVVVATPALAVATCDIGFTGPDSQNMCTSVETYSCAVTNQNEVTITNASNQTVASGSVVVNGSTTGGTSTSGSVSNSNGTTFTVTITNQEEEGVCTAMVVVPATETPPTVVPVTPVATSTPAKALPVTGTDSTLSVLAIVAGVALAVACASVIFMLLHRRMHVS